MFELAYHEIACKTPTFYNKNTKSIEYLTGIYNIPSMSYIAGTFCRQEIIQDIDTMHRLCDEAKFEDYRPNHHPKLSPISKLRGRPIFQQPIVDTEAPIKKAQYCTSTKPCVICENCKMKGRVHIYCTKCKICSSHTVKGSAIESACKDYWIDTVECDNLHEYLVTREQIDNGYLNTLGPVKLYKTWNIYQDKYKLMIFCKFYGPATYEILQKKNQGDHQSYLDVFHRLLRDKGYSKIMYGRNFSQHTVGYEKARIANGNDACSAPTWCILQSTSNIWIKTLSLSQRAFSVAISNNVNAEFGMYTDLNYNQYTRALALIIHWDNYPNFGLNGIGIIKCYTPTKNAWGGIQQSSSNSCNTELIEPYVPQIAAGMSIIVCMFGSC